MQEQQSTFIRLTLINLQDATHNMCPFATARHSWSARKPDWCYPFITSQITAFHLLPCPPLTHSPSKTAYRCNSSVESPRTHRSSRGPSSVAYSPSRWVTLPHQRFRSRDAPHRATQYPQQVWPEPEHGALFNSPNAPMCSSHANSILDVARTTAVIISRHVCHCPPPMP
jgi:hypothetical protein